VRESLRLIPMHPDFSTAVALDGTVIHKSGLITGGRSTRDSTKKWDETDVKGMPT